MKSSKYKVQSSKLIILFVLLFAGVASAQWNPVQNRTQKYNSMAKGDSVATMVYLVAGNSLTVGQPGNITNGTKSISSTATQITTSASGTYILLSNISGTTIYIGGSGVTTSTGLPIYNNTERMIYISDPSQLYGITSSGTATLRYAIFY
ncbi:hypothetical protein D6827_02690 [Candidatus Parcubacteria bacterium]|nr:MAG: hypothetical protein D6827_02690 [Candidatus Parcubacteria bacterium]